MISPSILLVGWEAMLLLVTVSHRWHQLLHILQQLSGTDILLGKSLCKYASECQCNVYNISSLKRKFWCVSSWSVEEIGFMMLEKLDYIDDYFAWLDCTTSRRMNEIIKVYNHCKKECRVCNAYTYEYITSSFAWVRKNIACAIFRKFLPATLLKEVWNRLISFKPLID